jgi:hypothetical protein
MSVVAGGIIGRNVAIVKPQLASFGLGIGVTQIYLAFPDGFNLRTLKDNSRLKAFLDMIIVISLAINRNHAGIFRHMEILAPARRVGNLCGALTHKLDTTPEIATHLSGAHNNKTRRAIDDGSRCQITAVILNFSTVLFL